ncbi:MAG: EAL domain-containing protein, partial [Actinobacteria bacterium]|nr:EAL domain-containing protein [Actinomycetota bacterium]
MLDPSPTGGSPCSARSPISSTRASATSTRQQPAPCDPIHRQPSPSRRGRALCFNLGLEVVAEGIETQKAWDHLLTLGCRIGQGYFISR